MELKESKLKLTGISRELSHPNSSSVKLDIKPCLCVICNLLNCCCRIWIEVLVKTRGTMPGQGDTRDTMPGHAFIKN